MTAFEVDPDTVRPSHELNSMDIAFVPVPLSIQFETKTRGWLKEALEIQWDYKNLVRRKGRLERLKLWERVPGHEQRQ